MICHVGFCPLTFDFPASGQVSYLGGRFLVQLKLYSRFPEQVHKGVISVAAKGYESLYPGIDQHLGTQYAR
jgi:hypothetical protein